MSGPGVKALRPDVEERPGCSREPAVELDLLAGPEVAQVERLRSRAAEERTVGPAHGDLAARAALKGPVGVELDDACSLIDAFSPWSEAKTHLPAARWQWSFSFSPRRKSDRSSPAGSEHVISVVSSRRTPIDDADFVVRTP